MKLYKLKKGDLLVAGENAGVVTKVTKGYVYYFFRERVCRTSKAHVWNSIDSKKLPDVDVRYANTKRRRKKRTDRMLDLHGTQHDKVDEKVREFLNFVELPCKIVTGKSDKMRKIVEKIVEEYGWRLTDTANNFGALEISEE
tara:strand:+ start:2685 stop:3110 length:426 start_codon:yes stop_codon:yes gene_type:complete